MVTVPPLTPETSLEALRAQLAAVQSLRARIQDRVRASERAAKTAASAGGGRPRVASGRPRSPSSSPPATAPDSTATPQQHHHHHRVRAPPAAALAAQLSRLNPVARATLERRLLADAVRVETADAAADYCPSRTLAVVGPLAASAFDPPSTLPAVEALYGSSWAAPVASPTATTTTAVDTAAAATAAAGATPTSLQAEVDAITHTLVFLRLAFGAMFSARVPLPKVALPLSDAAPLPPARAGVAVVFPPGGLQALAAATGLSPTTLEAAGGAIYDEAAAVAAALLRIKYQRGVQGAATALPAGGADAVVAQARIVADVIAGLQEGEAAGEVAAATAAATDAPAAAAAAATGGDSVPMPGSPLRRSLLVRMTRDAGRIFGIGERSLAKGVAAPLVTAYLGDTSTLAAMYRAAATYRDHAARKQAAAALLTVWGEGTAAATLLAASPVAAALLRVVRTEPLSRETPGASVLVREPDGAPAAPTPAPGGVLVLPPDTHRLLVAAAHARHAADVVYAPDAWLTLLAEWGTAPATLAAIAPEPVRFVTTLAASRAAATPAVVQYTGALAHAAATLRRAFGDMAGHVRGGGSRTRLAALQAAIADDMAALAAAHAETQRLRAAVRARHTGGSAGRRGAGRRGRCRA